MKVVLAAVPYINTRIPSLSLASLAGHLKANGISAKSLDFNIDAYQKADEDLKKFWKMTQGFQWSEEEIYRKTLFPRIVEPNLDRWCDLILAENPQMLGISITDSPVAVELAAEIKKRRPELPIVAGGPSCSRAYADKYFRGGSVVDAIVDGEGEETLLELARMWESEGGLRPIAGATVIREGIAEFGGFRPPVKDLSSLALPDFSDFDLSLYTDEDSYGGTKMRLELPVYSSRGCVAKCRYCVDYKMWQSYRFKDPVRFADELEHLFHRYGATQFFFVELLLNGSHRWLKEFSGEIRKRQLNFFYHSHGRISASMNSRLLGELRESGLFHINYGLESGSDKVLKKMWKGYKVKEASRCIKDTYKAGISMTVNLVIGFPGENTWDCLKTIWFVFLHRRYIFSKPNLAICDAVAGSDLYLYPEELGIIVDKEHPQYFMTWRTTDGRNTYKVRKFRRDLMDWVFSRLKFQESYPSEQPEESWKQKLYRLYIAQPRKLLGSLKE